MRGCHPILSSLTLQSSAMRRLLLFGRYGGVSTLLLLLLPAFPMPVCVAQALLKHSRRSLKKIRAMKDAHERSMLMTQENAQRSPTVPVCSVVLASRFLVASKQDDYV